jgi:hypothetical protein
MSGIGGVDGDKTKPILLQMGPENVRNYSSSRLHHLLLINTKQVWSNNIIKGYIPTYGQRLPISPFNGLGKG